MIINKQLKQFSNSGIIIIIIIIIIVVVVVAVDDNYYWVYLNVLRPSILSFLQKGGQLNSLQSATRVITKCDDYYKVRQNTPPPPFFLEKL